MSNRHLSRTIAMQSLYEWDFHGQGQGSLPEILARTLAEFAPDFDDQGFVKELVDGVMAHAAAIDKTIVKYAPEWPIEQITIVDRNILRIGVYELVFAQNIPSKVAINEAIEIAKAFGGESSGRFVNGVLGAIYRDRVAGGELKKVDQEDKKPKEEKKEKKPKVEKKSPAAEEKPAAD